MEPSSKKRLGCWFSMLLERRTRHHGVAPDTFGASAQTLLDDAQVAPSPTNSSQTGTRRGSRTRAGLSLADLLPGECGYISRLAGEAQGRLRLLEMGMTPGTHVQVTRAAAFGGPLDVNVRGYQLSLRREEAALVWLGDAPALSEISLNDGAEAEDGLVASPVFAVTVQAQTERKREKVG